jgi:hypothetical protein
MQLFKKHTPSSYARVVSNLSFVHPRFQHQHMCTPTFVDMRQRMERVWFESRDCQEYVQWAGIFGSIARDRAGDGSDVDVLVVFKDHIRSGQPIDLHEGVFSST